MFSTFCSARETFYSLLIFSSSLGLQNVSIVVYDRSMAKKFKNILQQTTQVPMVGAAISDEDEEDDSVESDDDNAAPGIDDVDISVSNDSDDELPWINLEEDQTSCKPRLPLTNQSSPNLSNNF